MLAKLIYYEEKYQNWFVPFPYKRTKNRERSHHKNRFVVKENPVLYMVKILHTNNPTSLLYLEILNNITPHLFYHNYICQVNGDNKNSFEIY
jgi:hypothetical protein